MNSFDDTEKDTEKYWNEFERTGSIASYMNYKSAVNTAQGQTGGNSSPADAKDIEYK